MQGLSRVWCSLQAVSRAAGTGYRLVARCFIKKSWYVAATYFDILVVTDPGDNIGYRRVMPDTSFKY